MVLHRQTMGPFGLWMNFTSIAELIALGAENHMMGKVPETQDFYEASRCSSITVSTCAVLGNRSTASARAGT